MGTIQIVVFMSKNNMGGTSIVIVPHTIASIINSAL